MINKYFKASVIISLIVLLNSCSNKLNSELITKYAYHSNGNIWMQGTYLNDTISHGEFLIYYENGQLEKKRTYKYDKLDGWIYSYYENGNVRDSIFYVNGLKHGKAYWYYSNGKLEHIGNWRNDSCYGGNYFYFMNGKLEVYACDDVFDKVLYRKEWDSLGNVLDETGRLFSKYLRSNKDTLTINDTLHASFTVALPPHAKTEIYIGDVYNNDVENLQEYQVDNWTVDFSRIYSDTGIHKVGIIGVLKDDSNKTIWSDTLIKSFYVTN